MVQGKSYVTWQPLTVGTPLVAATGAVDCGGRQRSYAGPTGALVGVLLHLHAGNPLDRPGPGTLILYNLLVCKGFWTNLEKCGI
jgi:hypothetical protein